MKERRPKIKALECIGIAAVLLLLCSCLSFDIGDWPSSFVYPHSRPSSNWCGSIGAFLAYHLLYYVGPGVFVILCSGLCFLASRLMGRPMGHFLASRLMGRPMGQPLLRATGLVLLTIAASATFYCFWPYQVFNFPMGSGGVLGIAAVHFLRSHFATLGTFILISATWAVGTILLADSLFLMFFGWLGLAAKKSVGIAVPAWSVARQRSEVLGEIWQKLSAKQSQAPASVGGLRPDKDTRIEEKTEGAAAPAGQAEPGAAMVVSAPVQKASDSYIPKSYEDYTLPPLELLAEPEYSFAAVQEKVVKAKATALEKLLAEFNINARVVAADTGPVVTMFELELAAGVKVSQISTLANDMARALGVGAVRVVAPLPGKHTIGIEV
ncbi:MAG: DNA translocase FtsK 4TM domain-containing protein, partial [Planctomycetota bacterium]